MTIKFSIQRSAATNAVFNSSAETFKDFFDLYLADIAVRSNKMGMAFLPTEFKVPEVFKSKDPEYPPRQMHKVISRSERYAYNALSLSMACFDLDQDDDSYLISLEEAEDMLIDLGYEHAIYTSHSSTPDAPRFRIAIPFNREVYPEEYPYVMSATVEDLDEYTGGRFSAVLDRCWKNELSRCYYTPSRDPDSISAISFYNSGNPIDVLEMKLRNTLYLQDAESSSKKVKTGTKSVGAKGRSYEMCRILGAMFRGSTEEEIFEKLLDFDEKEHAGKEYFRDFRYTKHKPKPGENLEQTRNRNCLNFVKGHLSWLRRKVKSDFKIINKPGKNVGAVAQHDAVIQIYKAENIEKAGKETTKLSCKIISGEHAGAIFWHTLFGTGYSDQAIQVSQDLADRAKKASKQEINSIKDMIKLSGKIVKARIKYKPGTNGFPAQNEIGNIYIE